MGKKLSEKSSDQVEIDSLLSLGERPNNVPANLNNFIDIWLQAYLKLFFCYEAVLSPGIHLMKRLKKKKCRKMEFQKRGHLRNCINLTPLQTKNTPNGSEKDSNAKPLTYDDSI